MFAMKSALTCCLLALVSAVTAQTCFDSTCGAVITPLYRTYSADNDDHFYTNDASELVFVPNTASTYTPQGVAAGVFATQQGASVPLFRMFSVNPWDHFYTTDEQEVEEFGLIGYNLEGIAAYVYGDQICGSVPLFRLVHGVNVSGPGFGSDHFYTRLERQVALATGYTDQGIAAYVPIPGVVDGNALCETVPEN
ncbi:hypothetical protein MVEN_01746900 [Mycena venus]|uniref:DUF5648 domain-containing protein n=1 Tax=Mycena venus TaxID=2733690 RepID=A0A8H6XMK3_9AGAR|nr:hypothetical protein MVEN_01746900 [Mycena venus]